MIDLEAKFKRDIEKGREYSEEAATMVGDRVEENFKAEVSNIKTIFDETKIEVNKKMDSVIKKNRTKISKIKDVCTKYFDNYDGTLQGMNTKVKNVM